jgi:membrane protein YqaA with SNARE-associated domain
MDLLAQFLDIVLHLDKHLAIMVQQYGLWIYGILFFIIFAETGFVVTPFLPGDSLLFVAGALAAIGEGGMDIFTLMGVLTAAAVIGNTVNYQIGRFSAPRSSSGKTRGSSIGMRWSRRMLSTKNMAARRWCCRASCRCFARLRRLWPVLAR